MNLPFFSTVIVLLFCIALFLIGILLLRRGRWPARSGTTPHCAKCNYILTGLTADRCPECGSLIHSSSIVHGERHRRPWLVFAGVAFGLLSLLPFGIMSVALFGNINWIQYRPQTWLLKDLDASLSADTSWREIQRRMAANSLSESQLASLSDKALEIQRKPNYLGPQTESSIFQFLGRRSVDGKLTAAQQDQFFDNALKVVLEIRPVAGSDDLIPYWMRQIGRGPNDWWTRTRAVEWSLDDGPVHLSNSGSSSGSSFGGGASGSSLPAGQPIGKHRLHLKVELATVHRGALPSTADGPFDRTVIRNLDSDFEVIPGHAPIATVTAPAADTLRPLFTFKLELNGNSLSINAHTEPSPVDLAFEVFIRADGKETRATGIYFIKNSGGGFGTSTTDYPKPLPDHVDVILRSSEAVARGTTNLTQIWKGEIVYENVPVKLPTASTSQPTTQK